MNQLKIKLILYALGALGSLAGVGWTVNYVASLPEKYREQGRIEERNTYKQASDAAVARAEKQLADKELLTEKERVKNAFALAKHEEKFNQYVSDVRAGRIAGLRIAKANICPARGEEIARAGGNEEEKTVGLPREIEEGLLRFADDRDKIIMAFEDFKQEVRIAKCFKETKE